MRLAFSGLALLLALAACDQPRQTRPADIRYTVGEPYQLGGTWSYPREDFALSESGLAVVIPDSRPGRRTTDGETYDPTALVGAHRTLQLPVILRVTNLENGREILLRVNDRGPSQPGRMLGVSRRAAQFLQMPESGATRVRVTVEEAPSRALAGGQLPNDTPRLEVATAPSARLEAEDLAPPPGAREGARRGGAGPRAQAAVAPEAQASSEAVPLRLPEQIWQGPVGGPSRLWLDLSTFTTRDAAQRFAARVPGARIEPVGNSRRPEWRVRRGPYNSVPEVDQALEQTLRFGINEARVVVDY